MFAQLFGNYLLEKKYITAEQYLDAMAAVEGSILSLETKAIYSGYVTPADLPEIHAKMSEGKSFGMAAMECGYLTDERIQALSDARQAKYLLLAQVLVEKGYMTWEDFVTYNMEYSLDNEIFDLELNPEHLEEVHGLIDRLFNIIDKPINGESMLYIELLFNNLSQYIGDDFNVLPPYSAKEYPVNYCVLQAINGPLCIQSYVDMTEDTAVEFAKRYSKENLTEFDDIAKASIEDFLNLQNGLFTVNMSNDFNVELQLDPPLVADGTVLTTENDFYVIPFVFPFGIVRFVVSISYVDVEITEYNRLA